MVAQKTSKSAKIFPLEKFRLYGTPYGLETNKRHCPPTVFRAPLLNG